MKKSIISVMLLLFTATAGAQSSPSGVVTNSVLSATSIVLNIGGWIFKDSKKVYYVQVESTADTSEEARQSAYRKAVELAVGAIVVGQREVLNDQQVKNNIVVYSSGYVEDYKIVSETRIGSKTRMVIDVWVSDSKIANYIQTLGQSQSEGTVNGDAIKRDWERNQAIAKTEYQRTQDGHKLLRTLLSDYPRVAYHPTVGKPYVSNYGQTIGLYIPIDIKFNMEYANSLGEALETTRQFNGINRRQPGVTINRSGVFSGWWRGAYSSNYVTSLFAGTFEQPTSMEITFYNKSGRVAHRDCWKTNSDLQGEFYGYKADTSPVNRGMGFVEEWHFTIDPTTTAKVNYLLNNNPSWGWSNDKFINWVSTLERVEARVVTTSQCPAKV